MQIRFCGAVRTTTGSMHLVDLNGVRILLDCGLNQGKRKEAFERNRHFPFSPASIDFLLLSHAHIDHSGNLPTLVRQGFRGQVLATPATRDLCDIMLRDAAHLQVRDVEYVNKKRISQGKNPFEPLYTPDDIPPTLERFRDLDYGEPMEVTPGVTVMFYDAGHILGSALALIEIRENGRCSRLLFTGDLGRKDMPILRDPVQVRDVDILLTESTYGNRRHPPIENVGNELAELVNSVVAARAKLVIPAFSVGRTQQVVYFLRELHRQRRIPPLPVFVDSPLSSRATEVYERHPECYDVETLNLLLDHEDPFCFRGLHYITEVEESKRLNSLSGPAIIISASGMCEGGRILHHLKNTIGDERNIILIIGYQAENTLGRRLVEQERRVRIFGEPFEVRARVHVINALSAHADREEMLTYVAGMGRLPERAFVVHGEMDQSQPFAAELSRMGVQEVLIPEVGQTVLL